MTTRFGKDKTHEITRKSFIWRVALFSADGRIAMIKLVVAFGKCFVRTPPKNVKL
jgi:hypothetical protein